MQKPDLLPNPPGNGMRIQSQEQGVSELPTLGIGEVLRLDKQGIEQNRDP